MPSDSFDDYLKAIYDLSSRSPDDEASVSGLARRMGVAPASVSGMVRRLGAARPPLVAYRRYRGIRLTAEGTQRALRMLRTHRLIETYLAETFGVPWDALHGEAERLEHAVSDDLSERMAAALGNPRRDPHGHPIPGRDGLHAGPPTWPLSESPLGQVVTVQQVPDRDPELLRGLAALGLRPGARVAVDAREPGQGGVSVRIGTHPLEIVPLAAASTVLVSHADQEGPND
jgi:DtxR family transcriptional regulator, Mn-dependent transcriptional regulator